MTNASLAKEDAAVMFHNTTKYNAADMYLNIIAKQNAVEYLSTTQYATTKLAKEHFANKNADMFQDTIGNASVVTLALLLTGTLTTMVMPTVMPITVTDIN